NAADRAAFDERPGLGRLVGAAHPSRPSVKNVNGSSDWMTVEATILPTAGRRQATVALMIATAMQAFDSTIANVALPQLQESLGGGIELGSWVMTSYLCASAIMATLTGWLRRRYGARPLFIGSIGLFIAASGLCSIAPSAVT